MGEDGKVEMDKDERNVEDENNGGYETIRLSGGERNLKGQGIGGLLRGDKILFQPMVRTVENAVKSKTAKAVGNATKEQVIEQGLNLAVEAVRGKDLVEENREGELRNWDVKSNDVKSSKSLKLSRSKKLKRDKEYRKMIKLLSEIESLKGCY